MIGRSGDDEIPETMMCAFNDRRAGGACFEPATHSYYTYERPTVENFACDRHARVLVDSGVADEAKMKKLAR